MCIINTLDKDSLNLLFYFKILSCFVHINQLDGQVVIQDMIVLCVPLWYKILESDWLCPTVPPYTT